MNKEIQRIAIAKARGWKSEAYWRQPIEPGDTPIKTAPPDYLRDLNACNDLVEEMGKQGWACVLVAECGKRCCTFVKGDVEHKVITTKFEDSICESFLRVLGLWEPIATNKEEKTKLPRRRSGPATCSKIFCRA